VRVTEQLVAGYDTYGFHIDRKLGAEEDAHRLPEIIDELLRPDSVLPGREFFLGGKIGRQMSDDVRSKLGASGVTLDRDPRRLLQTVAERQLGGK
jgi:CRISPR-associated protein Cst2